MKHCPYCQHSVQRWGHTESGASRFFCPSCRRTITRRKRKDVRERHLRHELDLWLGGKDNLREISEKRHETRQTFWKHMRPLLSFPFEPAIPRDPVHTLILDATYIHGNELCALVAIDENDRIFWRFAPHESYTEWYEFLKLFPRPKILVMDGQKGLFLAARSLWPLVPIQRCQFHVIAFCTQYTGRRPKDDASRSVLDLLYELKYAKTPESRDQWIRQYKKWESKYDLFLYARGNSGGYRYPKLRSIRYVIRKALPNLFTFIDHPGTPNTTNLVEGWVNAAVAEAIRRHRGIKDYEKKVLVSIILTHLVRGGDGKVKKSFYDSL
ncbi:MAG: transposase [bacterium]